MYFHLYNLRFLQFIKTKKTKKKHLPMRMGGQGIEMACAQQAQVPLGDTQNE